MRRRKPDHEVPGDDDEHEGAAPIVANPDDVDLERETSAPVYPTEADEAEAIDYVLKHSSAPLSTYALTRAVQERLAENAQRAVRRQRAAAASMVDEGAPVFPTEAHVVDLREAIPGISDDDEAAVMRAGYAAFLASIDAREPVLNPATEE